MTKGGYIGMNIRGIKVWMYPCEEVKEDLSLPYFDKVIPFKVKNDNNVGPLIGLTQNPTLEELIKEMNSFEIEGGYVTPLGVVLVSPYSIIHGVNFLYLIEKGENQFCLSLCVEFKKSIEQIKLVRGNRVIINPLNLSQNEIEIQELLSKAYPQSSEELPTGHDSILKGIITNVPEKETNFEELKKIAEDAIV